MKKFIAKHPLTSYYILTFLITWSLFIPILLSPRALNIIQMPDVLSFIFFLLATILGPLLSAVICTQIADGKKEVTSFLKRIVMWKVRARWYILIILGYPLLLFLGLLLFYGVNPITLFNEKWMLLFTTFFPLIPINMLIPGLGEETGWRGFALPRMQKLYGAVIGTLLLASLHALWHLPAYFVPGAITDTFTFQILISNSLAIILSSVIWTWIFNNAKQSILIAILLHATSNATSSFATQIYTTNDPWQMVKIFGLAAVIVFLISKGKLGYEK